MKLFGSRLLGQTIKAAGIGAALMVSVSAGHAQSSGPFAGFDGQWSGTGTVALLLGGAESVFGLCDAFQNLPGLKGVYGHATGQPTKPVVPARPAAVA